MSSLLDVVVGKQLTISRHAHERWEERFPGKCMISAMLNANRVRATRLVAMWGINPMDTTCYYDSETTAMFIASFERGVVLTVISKEPKGKKHRGVSGILESQV